MIWPSRLMLMISCLGGAESGVSAEVRGSSMPISFSTCAKVVAAMKKISRLKTMSVNGTRLYGSSCSCIGSRIRMGHSGLQRGGRSQLGIGLGVEAEVIGEVGELVVELADQPLDAAD